MGKKNSTNSLLEEVVAVLKAHKADNLVTLDISDKSTLAKYMVVVSADSSRHVKSLAEHLLKEVRPHCKCYAEGIKDGNWVIVSFLDIMVHIFRSEVRDYYNIEELWSKNIVNQEDMVAE